MEVVSTGSRGVNIEDFDMVCPYCLKPIPHVSVSANLTVKEETLEVIYRCPRVECRRLHVGVFSRSETKATYYLLRSIPSVQAPTIFESLIHDVSPEFAEIYNQALNAEQKDLHHICGMGYRKALEFLIKDYASCKNPDDAELIKSHKMQLGQVIQTYIQHEAIKETAKRAAWLGNDEAHYTRKWHDKDINDLKALINLTVQWIKLEQMTLKYTAEMQ